ncbi:MAG TPA: argininosuccinate lyase [Polyangiales bacterium]|nr:argininosuccinate lyase [Polyangiales bacterium]
MSDKSWGGRFQEDLDAQAAAFSASVDVDKRLAPFDIRGSIAHARMLGARGILATEDVEKIESGLRELAGEIERGEFQWNPAQEDVHMNIEAALTERIGEAGARLHTARSRNDQVATDMRMFTRDACRATAGRIDALQAVLVQRAETSVHVLLPGYTHLQRAQPVRLSHHLLAWCEMLDRDRARLLDAAKRMNLSPLGSGALTATTFAIDRSLAARELEFDGVTRNSLDAVADRDFLVETVAALANCAIHLSRISEELVLWSTQEFGFVQMSDAFTTGSSMMPQKKNPDMAELVRGKSGRVVGDLVALIVMLKGLPLAYNRDLQEDKPPVFDAFDTVDACLTILSGSIAAARFDVERMKRALREGFLEATELADYLAARGVPFRHAHHVAGRLVHLAVTRGVTLSELTLAELQNEHPSFDADIWQALDPEIALERRNVPGGPAKPQQAAEIARWMAALSERGCQLDAIAQRYRLRTEP